MNLLYDSPESLAIWQVHYTGVNLKSDKNFQSFCKSFI